jgi:hypothetical protein
MHPLVMECALTDRHHRSNNLRTYPIQPPGSKIALRLDRIKLLRSFFRDLSMLDQCFNRNKSNKSTNCTCILQLKSERVVDHLSTLLERHSQLPKHIRQRNLKASIVASRQRKKLLQEYNNQLRRRAMPVEQYSRDSPFYAFGNMPHPVCQNTFMYLFGIGKHQWSTLQKNLMNNCHGANHHGNLGNHHAVGPHARRTDIAMSLTEEDQRDVLLVAADRAMSLMRPLTEAEQRVVQEAVRGTGPANEALGTSLSDSVQRVSMQTLQPGQWLGDEVIHAYSNVLRKRDEALCKRYPSRRRSHFFKSFFMTKLLNEGRSDTSIEGQYLYRNVERWSKNVPGKDIFNLDKIFFTINQAQSHWVCAVAFMQEKRIQMYDSLGGKGLKYLESILQYFKDEHLDKKGTPLPDADNWEIVVSQTNTPRQRNGMFFWFPLHRSNLFPNFFSLHSIL